MKKNGLEWSVFGVSFAIIVATVAILVRAHLTSADRPPAIVVTIGEPLAQAGGFAVPLDVANTGDRTAQAVVIEVILSRGGSDDRHQVELAFVPHGSHRRAWVVFPDDPRGGTLKARVIGYEEP